MSEHKKVELLDELNNLKEKLREIIKEKYPQYLEDVEKLETELKDQKIFCECLGDIDYDKGVNMRFPFKPDMYDVLDDIEKADPILKIDRNKGYCNSKLFNMCWLTNGEPVIIMRAYERNEKGGMVLSIHQADHPEWYPTPNDIDEFVELETMEI